MEGGGDQERAEMTPCWSILSTTQEEEYIKQRQRTPAEEEVSKRHKFERKVEDLKNRIAYLEKRIKEPIQWHINVETRQ